MDQQGTREIVHLRLKIALAIPNLPHQKEKWKLLSNSGLLKIELVHRTG